MTKCTEKGFSLIEVLVSILVLAIGIIGAAGMQLSAFRTAQQSAFQTFALHLASDMADAIRAYGERSGQEHNANPYVGMDYRAGIHDQPVGMEKSCYASACDADEYAKFQMYEWKMRLNSTLPGGRIQVCRDGAASGDEKNALTWDCSSGEGQVAPIMIKLGWQAKSPDGSPVRDATNDSPPGMAITVGL